MSKKYLEIYIYQKNMHVVTLISVTKILFNKDTLRFKFMYTLIIFAFFIIGHFIILYKKKR